MSSPLYLIATIYPAAQHRAEVLTALDTLIAASQAESGCEMYDLVQGEGEEVWVMMEKWSSKEHWDAHMTTAHVQTMGMLDKAFFTRETELRFLHPVK
jgi:quinol monooxygenase YgiN